MFLGIGFFRYWFWLKAAVGLGRSFQPSWRSWVVFIEFLLLLFLVFVLMVGCWTFYIGINILLQSILSVLALVEIFLSLRFRILTISLSIMVKICVSSCTQISYYSSMLMPWSWGSKIWVWLLRKSRIVVDIWASGCVLNYIWYMYSIFNSQLPILITFITVFYNVYVIMYLTLRLKFLLLL